jgi:hypothetical protein
MPASSIKPGLGASHQLPIQKDKHAVDGRSELVANLIRVVFGDFSDQVNLLYFRL